MESARLQEHELDPGRTLVIGGEQPLVDLLARALDGAGVSAVLSGAGELDLAVYLPGARGNGEETPDLEEAGPVLRRLGELPECHVILVASAEVYAPSHRHSGHLSEERLGLRPDANRIAHKWLDLERLAASHVDAARLTVLRPTFVPVRGGRDYASRLFARRGVAMTAPGHDPSLQILSPEDLAEAVRLAVRHRPTGTYNVAPDSVVPLRHGLRLAGSRALSIPLWLQRLLRGSMPRSTGVASADRAEYLRYSWTVSGQKLRRELGFSPRLSSAEALASLGRSDACGTSSGPEVPEPTFDPFGMDRGYIDSPGRTLRRFAHDRYWRVEFEGLENVPREGPAVLVGVHRGFMPFDGVMTVHALARYRKRYLRFLIHPTLVKFPFLADFITRLGGIVACRENGDWVLERDGLLGVYPEGIRGAFSYYRDAYRLQSFRRYDFVSMALRNGAPIIPFVTLGTAETFPILAKVRWSWWRRYSEWPCLPITPTFPLVPLPLPSKWHTRFLEPLHVHRRHPPEVAEDRATVQAIGNEVRTLIADSLEEMRRRRKRVFWGSVFGEQSG